MHAMMALSSRCSRGSSRMLRLQKNQSNRDCSALKPMPMAMPYANANGNGNANGNANGNGTKYLLFSLR
jgi:hypothetical protein